MNWLGGFLIIGGLALAANEGQWMPWLNLIGCAVFLFGAKIVKKEFRK